MKSKPWVILGLVAALLVTGCAHTIKRPGPTLAEDLDRLESELDLLPPFPVPESRTGSLWTEAGPGAALVADTRAFRVNDLVTVVVREQSLGTNQSTTDLSRLSEAEVGAPTALGFEKPTTVAGSFSLNKLLSSSTETTFSGEGTTSRGNTLTGFVTARVMRADPNGNMVIAGQKTVMINRERQILTLVGTIRAVDVGPANRVSSNAIGDLTVRLWGRGEVDATVRQGWFMRVLNRIWPF